MKPIYILGLILLSISLSASEPAPLSSCGSGFAAPTDSTNFLGACRIPPSTIPFASVSAAAFGGGQRCGECFRLTGPLGSTVVMISDKCDTGEACQQQDLFHFIIPRSEFDKIGNSSAYGNIFSLGYQEVSCDLQGGINANFIAGGEKKDQYQYYFSVTFSNFAIGIKRVQIRGYGWSYYDDLTIVGGGSGFQWNKVKANEMAFPASMLLTSVDNQIVNWEFNKPLPNVTIDSKKQFTARPHPEVSGIDCAMGILPEYIFKDTLSFGWQVYESFYYKSLNTSSEETDDNNKNGEYVIKIQFAQLGAGLQFTREGGFGTNYLKTLFFDAKAVQPISNMRIYFGYDGGYSIPFTIESSYKTFQVPVADLKPKNIEYSLTFLSLQPASMDSPQNFWIDNIRWEFANGTVTAPAVMIDTSGYAFPTSKPSTSGGLSSGISSIGMTSGFSESDSQTGGVGTGSESTNEGSGSDSSKLVISNIYYLALFVLSLYLLF
ncbi:hypothetical protein CYY_003223 [Polysphondylium violaceum]|uniref:Expansin-like EG45 domain-containing protein n=1 Tax=Polysphondylium violaceum TaxID=133409 RepID=A0A8J4PYN5_9MYCE|nr:hypothetical protein CYY_003223 [Polysphondylium violaceum]